MILAWVFAIGHFRVVAALSLVLLPYVSYPQSGPEPFNLQRIDGPILIDGVSNEPGWKEVAPVHLTTHLPTFGKVPSERTEIRVAYDKEYLYVAASCYDADQNGVQGNSLSRDRWSASDDQLALILDTFNDNENALAFITTPAGRRIDFSIVNDNVERGNNPVDESWNTMWDVATVKSERGWCAEMRIPFSSLRFEEKDNTVVMGLIVWRWIAGKTELCSFPPIPRNWTDAFIKPSVGQDVRFENIQHRNPLYIMPYVLGGLHQAFRLNGVQSTYDRFEDRKAEVGADLKYNITSNLILDLTTNTDFAQVEADNLQINLTRFSLFFPEKRQFFLERASIFDFNTGDDSRLFHSRRIGLSDAGVPIRILGGGRLTGRTGGWDIGMLDMQTSTSETAGGENAGVLRLRRQVVNEYSNIGGMITSRVNARGRYNVAYGLDGTFNIVGEEFLYLNWVQTFQDSVRSRSLDNARIRLLWERNSVMGLGYNLSVTSSAKHYNPGLGFQSRENFTDVKGHILWGWIPLESSSLQAQRLSLDGTIGVSNSIGKPDVGEVSIGWYGESRQGEFYEASVRSHFDRLPITFNLSENAFVPAGSYTTHSVDASYRRWGKLLRGTISVHAGSYYDGSQITVALSPQWSISPHLQIASDYQLTDVRFPNRGQKFTGSIVRFRTDISVDIHLTITSFVQWNSAAHISLFNFRLRYNFAEGNDLFLLCNGDFNLERNRLQPVLPTSNERSILVKYTHAILL